MPLVSPAMVHLDDIEIGPLLHLSVWEDAHECLDDEEDGKKKRRPYEDLYDVLPLWLYARMCIEEELEARSQGRSDRGEDKESALHDKKNQSTMNINRLPRTTLARIFKHLRDEYVYCHCHQSSTDASEAAVHAHGEHTYPANPYSWLGITLVCRRWRNTAYTHAPLWTFVDLAYDKETVRSLLILSNKEPLCIHWDSSSATETATGDSRDVSRVTDVGELAIKLDLVMDEQTCFKELDLTFSSSKFIKLFPWKQFASFPIRRLTKLVLKATLDDVKGKGKDKDKTKHELRVLPALRETNFPELRELVLDGLYPKWRETRLPKLWRLELRNVLSDSVGEGDDDRTGTGPGEFVGFLSHCGSLRSLKIDGLRISNYL